MDLSLRVVALAQFYLDPYEPSAWKSGVAVHMGAQLEGYDMNLLWRFLRWLARLVFDVLFTLASVLLQLIILPALLLVLRACRDLIFFSFRATVFGPARFIDRLAGEWTARFHQVVEDREHIDEVFLLCRLAAGSLVILGWLLTLLFTVEILRVVFGHFI